MLKSAIPFVDLRGRTPIDLLRHYPDKAHELIAASARIYGVASRAASFLALPWADRRSRAWLERSRNPYLYEIESFAEILRKPGIYALNLSYEWGCTGGLFHNSDSVAMLRVLDWPFPALGKHVMAVLQAGKAGEFVNLTWPGVSGVYTAMAPGRFSAAIHLAPMRMHRRGTIGDWLKNRLIADKEEGMPPPHLLRQVCEQAGDYDTAKAMLSEARLAVPSIFLLAGVRAGEGCVIERLENTAEIIELGAKRQLAAGNHFVSSLSGVGAGWRSREPDSQGRWRQCGALHAHDLADHFDWLRAPMLNQYTRLCAVADAAENRLIAQGFEGMAQVTGVFALPAEYRRKREAAG